MTSVFSCATTDTSVARRSTQCRRSFIAAVLALTCVGMSAGPAVAQSPSSDLTVVAGAGYKKPMLKIVELYRASSGQSVAAAFGNMQQISAQAQASGDVALMVGDEKFLRQLTFLSGWQPLGEGKLVLAWRKGRAAVASDAELLAADVGRIGVPDAVKAIYGLAATEWMKGKGLHDRLNSRLITTATVPQVSTYLVSGEVDAGFINLTEAIELGERIGGYRVLEDGYAPIRLVAATVAGHEANAKARAFLDFMKSAPAAAVFRSAGM